MSGICGWVGEAPRERLEAMLHAIDYRGDTSDSHLGEGFALGYRFWAGRPGKSPRIRRAGDAATACAGTLAPPVPSPAEALAARIASADFADLDGAFAAADWDGRGLTLIRDPFGVRSLYFTEREGTFYFASELKQLVAPGIAPAEIDPVAIHKYLTFSFFPGETVPIKGVRRLLPGHLLRLAQGRAEVRPYFELREEIDPALEERREAARTIRERFDAAIEKRLNGEREVGLYLSGGIDSSGVAHRLVKRGVQVRALSLDFGPRSVEKQQAAAVARHLGIDHTFLAVDGSELAPLLPDLVYKLDLPFGDAVVGPQFLLGRAARERGLQAVFNGEGGDQLFGGWTSKPMIAAEIYAGFLDDRSREEQYLASYHRFYGLEERLYTPELKAQVGGPGQRRAHLQPYLGSDRANTFLNRVRLADLSLKGSQNILPRAERMSNAWGLDVRVPLFDRQLAEASFRLPPAMKLRGATEKYILKWVLRKALPEDVVWRRKFGMSVPITDWVLGPLAGLVEELIGRTALERRGLFRDDFVARLRAGENVPDEVRRRRVGERLWALIMLEAWMRVFVDGRGAKPAGLTR
jgi:asparagine synthase (glutamine-hydrolysing)